MTIINFGNRGLSGADKQNFAQKHRIYVGTWYETHFSVHASETVIDLRHGRPGSVHRPAHIHLLHVSFPVKRTIMGIKYFLPGSNMPISATAKMVNLSILVAGIFKINLTPQQSTNIFKKTHPQEANHHGIHIQTREQRLQWQGICRYIKLRAFIRSNILPQLLHHRCRNGISITTPQPKPLPWAGITTTTMPSLQMRAGHCCWAKGPLPTAPADVSFCSLSSLTGQAYAV